MIKSEQLINELKGLYDELEEEMESDFRNPEAFLTEGNRNLLLARINDISIVKVRTIYLLPLLLGKTNQCSYSLFE